MKGKSPRSSSSTPATSRRLVALFAITCLLIGATPGVAAGSTSLVDLDEDTPITERDMWREYLEDDVATAEIGAPDLDVTIAREHEDVGVERGFHNDYSNEYIRVEYNEDIDRTIRFYVPSNYWKPYYDESVDSIAGDDVTAKFVPVDGGKFTAVTISFSGPTDAVFPASQIRGDTWSFWSEQDERLEEATGFSSGISGNDQWNYASSTDWSNGTLVVENVSNPDRVSIQYDADVSSDEAVWLQVPEGESDRTPVYYFVRDSTSETENESTTIMVVSKQSEPPAVRIKKSANPRDGIGSLLSDWSRIPDRFDSFVDKLFGSSRK